MSPTQDEMDRAINDLDDDWQRELAVARERIAVLEQTLMSRDADLRCAERDLAEERERNTKVEATAEHCIREKSKAEALLDDVRLFGHSIMCDYCRVFHERKRLAMWSCPFADGAETFWCDECRAMRRANDTAALWTPLPADALKAVPQ